MLKLSWKNFRQYFISYLPALLILGLGTSLINVILKVKQGMDDQLHKNVAGIDLLVGAKGSPIQLTLANIYHLDDPTGNISLDKAEQLASNPMIATAIPLAYGDNHQGYKILGTSIAYIQHFGGELEEGKFITKPFEVVVGEAVARKLDITIGYTFHSTHGTHSGHQHTENKYQVVGILKTNNTVLDKLMITSISSLWQSHDYSDFSNTFDSLSFIASAKMNKTLGYKTAVYSKGNHQLHQHQHTEENTAHLEGEKAIQKKEITALLLKFRGAAGFFLLNQINQDPELMAINPAQTVTKFLTVLGVGYGTVEKIALGVIIVAIITLMLTLIQIFQRRKYEMALLRVMGSSKFSISLSLLGEVFLIIICGFLIGYMITFGTIQLLTFFVEKGIFESFKWSFIGKDELSIFFVCFICGMISVLIPLVKVYSIDLSKTLSHEA